MTGGRLVAGVDCSTQSTKILLVDPDTGEVVARGQAAHVVSGTDGARESDPRGWWSAVRDALAETGRAGEVGAISVAGQQHGLVVLDGAGEPLRDASLWNDTRAAADAERLTEALGAERWASLTGLRPNASFTVSKWAWLRRTEPAVAAAARAVQLPHDYVTGRLTGAAATDRGDASGHGLVVADDRRLRAGHPRPSVGRAERRPPAETARPARAAGEVTSAVADELGLARGTVVGPGTGDNMGAALGLGLGVGQTAMSLGTSGTIFAVSERPTADPTGVVAGFADASGRFLPLACTLNCTLAVDRIATWLGLDRDDVAPAGSVVVYPYLDGERTPDLPGAAGTILGLRHTSTPQQILMATYEGAAAALLEALDAIGTAVGGLDDDAPLMLVGGGSRGRTWVDVVRRLSGRPVLIPDADELVAIGAAVQATAAWRDEDPAAIARRWGTSAGRLLDPLPRDDERLDRIAAFRGAIELAATAPAPGS